MVVLHKKWDWPPFSDTSYFMVSMPIGMLCWSLYSPLPVIILKFPLKLLLKHVVGGDFPCGKPQPVEVYHWLYLTLAISQYVLLIREDLSSTLTTLNTKADLAIRVLLECSILTFWRHLPIRQNGGKAYPSKSTQLMWKALVIIAPGSGLLLTYLSNWWFNLVANRSTVHGPR